MLGPETFLMEMPAGDFSFFGLGAEGVVRVGIERKTRGDFVSSVQSGRLFDGQRVGMLQYYDVRYLLLEGEFPAVDDFRRGSMAKRTTLYEAANSWCMATGSLLIRATDVHDSVDWIEALYAWWSRPWNSHKSAKAIHSGPLMAGSASTAERIYAQIPGVGPERARVLAEAYPKPMAAARAGEDGLMELEGFGQKLAGKVIEALG